MLLATTPYSLLTSELQKVLESCRVFVHFQVCIFTWKCASGHSGVQFSISPLTTWPRTRRFKEAIFRLTRHTNHLKHTAGHDFSNIWRGCCFFLPTFALLHLLSFVFTSSHLLFIWFSTHHIVASLLLKLPSTTVKKIHNSLLLRKKIYIIISLFFTYNKQSLVDYTDSDKTNHLFTPIGPYKAKYWLYTKP